MLAGTLLGFLTVTDSLGFGQSWGIGQPPANAGMGVTHTSLLIQRDNQTMCKGSQSKILRARLPPAWLVVVYRMADEAVASNT